MGNFGRKSCIIHFTLKGLFTTSVVNKPKIPTIAKLNITHGCSALSPQQIGLEGIYTTFRSGKHKYLFNVLIISMNYVD